MKKLLFLLALGLIVLTTQQVQAQNPGEILTKFSIQNTKVGGVFIYCTVLSADGVQIGQRMAFDYMSDGIVNGEVFGRLWLKQNDYYILNISYGLVNMHPMNYNTSRIISPQFGSNVKFIIDNSVNPPVLTVSQY